MPDQAFTSVFFFSEFSNLLMIWMTRYLQYFKPRYLLDMKMYYFFSHPQMNWLFYYVHKQLSEVSAASLRQSAVHMGSSFQSR